MSHEPRATSMDSAADQRGLEHWLKCCSSTAGESGRMRYGNGIGAWRNEIKGVKVKFTTMMMMMTRAVKASAA